VTVTEEVDVAVVLSNLHWIWVSVVEITAHLAPSLNATETKVLSIGKPVPVIVRVFPPIGLMLVGLTEETTSGIETAVTPEATGIKP